MPIHSYKCQECGEIFDFLVGVGTGGEEPACPKCKSKKVEKIFSPFGIQMGGSTCTTYT